MPAPPPMHPDADGRGTPGPTRAELEAALARLDPGPAARIRANARPAPSRPGQSTPQRPAPLPAYSSWDDYLARTTPSSRRRWCARKATKANADRLMSGRPATRITADDVQAVLHTARGRCAHCGSLAVESRPSAADGRPLPWAIMGRRIGSLGHRVTRFEGGDNAAENLVWCCLWCNTWPSERIPGSTDHGGFFPDSARQAAHEG
jgi:hypothetical protein